MTVDVLHPPQEVWTRISEWIGALAGSDAFMTRRLCQCHPSDLSLAASQPRFSLPFEDVRLGGSFERAYMVSWRYLVCAAGEAVAFAELAAEGPHDPGEDLALSEGPVVRATAAVLDALKGGSDNGLRTHALGILSMPMLHAEAVWLRHRRQVAGRDRFIPVLLPSGGRLQQILRPGEFMEELVNAKAALHAKSLQAAQKVALPRHVVSSSERSNADSTRKAVG